jgi:hypothetical protein
MGAGMAAERDAFAIAERLIYVVRDTKHDDPFTGASAAELTLRIIRGVATMVADGRTDDADVREAETGLRSVLEEMDRARDVRGLSTFSEETVDMAFMRFCPGFFPFC